MSLDECAAALRAGTPLLLVDVRPYSAFALSHIAGAINVRLSNILMRRLAQGKIAVEDLLNDAHKAVFHRLADTVPVVVYDERAVVGGEQDTKMIVINALRTAGRPTSFLGCTFADFTGACADLLEAEETLAPSLSLAVSQNIQLPKDSPAKVKITNLEPTQILPNLFIGARKDATNAATLARLKIGSIVNVTKDCPNQFEDSIQYLQIPVDDHWSQDLIQYLDQAIAFIDESRRKNVAVLVHCMAGISRSPSITIAYVMRDQKMTLNDAYNFVKSKRPAISPHLDFLGELMEYEKRSLAGGVAETAPIAASRQDSDSGVPFASSLLSENCPWLKLANMTPESSMDVDSAPPTPGHRASGTRPPWLSEFQAIPSQSISAERKDSDLERSTSDDDSGHSVEILVPCIVLAPVPKSKGFRRSISSTPAGSNNPSPPLGLGDSGSSLRLTSALSNP